MNNLLLKSALTLMTFLFVLNANAKDSQLEQFKAEIRAKYDVKEIAFDNNDTSFIDKFYSKDIISVGPDGKPHIGRDALRPGYDIVIKDTVKIESIDMHVDGDSGWDWTNFHVTPADSSKKPFSFIILFLWEKIDGEWFCTGDMFVVGKMNAMS